VHRARIEIVIHGLEFGEAGAGLERLEHRLHARLEPEPRELVERLGLDHEVRAEVAEIVEQALLG